VNDERDEKNGAGEEEHCEMRDLARRPQLPLPDPLQLRIHPLPHSCYPVMLQTPSSRLSAIRDLMVQQGRDAFVSCHARP